VPFRRLFREQFPADFISEALDQTRGWFYSLLAISTLLFDRSSYEHVVCLGLLLDEHGQKMSKSKGNIVDPLGVIDEHGADALRFTFTALATTGLFVRGVAVPEPVHAACHVGGPDADRGDLVARRERTAVHDLGERELGAEQ
jgi:hypothetical protein